MGVGSKVVVTGDVTQIDLPGSTRSGLVDALKVLKLSLIHICPHRPQAFAESG